MMHNSTLSNDCQTEGLFMVNLKSKSEIQKVDTKEFELPETHFVRDIEDSVFQNIIFQCLSKIEGIGLVEGNFIDYILRRGPAESLKGIRVEQDHKNHSVGIKIEVNICYGCSIPEKAEDIQTQCAEEITRLTGLHVSFVHVIFKNMLPADQMFAHPQPHASNIEDEYNDEF